MDRIMLALSVLYFCTLWTTGLTLECYTCQSSKITSGSSSSILAKLMGSAEENQACNEADITNIGTISTKQCAPNQVCGDVRASFTIKETVSNSEVTIESVGRGCMSSDSMGMTNMAGEYCEDGLNAVKGATNVLLSIANDIPFLDMKVDGEVCYCQTDLCSAGRCADDSFKVAGYCVKYWYVAVPAGILLLLILCCCCCCCCCCKKNQKPGFIIQQAFPAGIVHGQQPYVRFDGSQAQAATV